MATQKQLGSVAVNTPRSFEEIAAEGWTKESMNRIETARPLPAHYRNIDFYF
jgi:hypothetical protein